MANEVKRLSGGGIDHIEKCRISCTDVAIGDIAVKIVEVVAAWRKYYDLYHRGDRCDVDGDGCGAQRSASRRIEQYRDGVRTRC